MAVSSWISVTSCLLFIHSIYFSSLDARIVQPQIYAYEPGVLRQEIDKNVNSRIDKRDIFSRLSRSKRDSGYQDPKCVAQESVFQTNVQKSTKFSNEYSFDNETKVSMALAWAGLNTGVIIVVTTEEFFIFAKPSTLYRSEDNGKTFTNINARVNNAFIRKNNGLQKHPHKPERLFIVAHNHGGDSSKSVLYLTNDGGKTFTAGITLPFLLDGDIIFHPNETQVNSLMALSSHTQEVFMSKDGGQTWTKIHDRVINVKWSTSESDPLSCVYVAFHDLSINSAEDDTYMNTLVKSTDYGASWVKLISPIHNFGMQGKFLYTSVLLAEKDHTKRLMKVSTDNGKTWNEAQLPTITSDRFYSILDMTEGLIFIHVDNPGDTGHGTLYTSDGTGIVFSQSLEKHLYPNYQDVTDFYKVKSLRGVYLASQMSVDQSIHTVISFNRGAEWQAVKRPDGAPCKDETKACNLQIHNQYSIRRGVTAQPPLSSETATGIILVHGHVADALQTTPPDVFVSSDGGYSWRKSLDGPHHYQIADHGGLLVAVPADTATPNVVKFSTDEGRCWHTYNFTSIKLIFTGLLTEPGNKAMTVGIWGYGADDHRWRVYVIDFKEVINTQCGSSDYETWTAHSDMSHDQNEKYKGCLLGKREVFKRLKKDSWCYNGYSFEVQKSETICECTTDDYECDYGYIRPEGSTICIEDPKFKSKPKLDICLRGYVEEIVSEGYRLIPGDVCKGGYRPASSKMIVLAEHCQVGSKVIISEDMGLQQNEAAGHKANTTVIVAMVMLVLLLAVVLVIFFIHKFNLLRNRNVTYKYSILSQQTEEYDYDNDFENALTSRKELYEDTSDEEVLENNRRDLSKPSRSNGVKPPKVKQYHDDSDDDLLE